jgi:hypothetical protein
MKRIATALLALAAAASFPAQAQEPTVVAGHVTAGAGVGQIQLVDPRDPFGSDLRPGGIADGGPGPDGPRPTPQPRPQPRPEPRPQPTPRPEPSPKPCPGRCPAIRMDPNRPDLTYPGRVDRSASDSLGGW